MKDLSKNFDEKKDDLSKDNSLKKGKLLSNDDKNINDKNISDKENIVRKEKIALIDVGGGFRSIYGAGLMDYFLDAGVHFDELIGVSAGSANMASFIAGQRGRNLQFYTEYADRPEASGINNLINERNFINLDYLYGELSNSGKENPLDYKAIMDSDTDFVIVATDAKTGEAEFFTKKDIHQDDYRVFMASSALPVLCEPREIDGILYYDGGIGDPVPIDKAFDDGCTKIVLILTQPIDYTATPEGDGLFAMILAKEYPDLALKLSRRWSTYNAAVERAKTLEKQGKLFILAPADTYGISTIKRTEEGMMKLYVEGYRDGKKVLDFMGKDHIKG